MPIDDRELQLIRFIQEDLAEAMTALNKGDLIVVCGCLQDMQQEAAELHRLRLTALAMAEQAS